MQRRLAGFIVIALCAANVVASSSEISLKDVYPRSSAQCLELGRSFKVILAGKTRAQNDEEKDLGPPYVFVKGGTSSHLVSRSSDKYEDGYSFVKPLSGSQCDLTEALSASDSIVLVLFSRSNEPFVSLSSVFAYDVTKNQVVDLKKDIGGIEKFRTSQGKLEFNTIIPRSDAGTGIAQINGNSIEYVDTNDLKPWSKVLWKNNRISIEQDLELTWRESQWREYFKTKEQFAKASGWDPTEKKFANLWVLKAGPNYDLGLDCILPSKSREAKAGTKWFCKALSR